MPSSFIAAVGPSTRRFPSPFGGADAEDSRLHVAQPVDVAAHARRVVEQEGLAEPHDRVAQRVRLDGRNVVACLDLRDDQPGDHLDHPGVHGARPRGDDAQRGVALALDEGAQDAIVGEEAVKAVERFQQRLPTRTARLRARCAQRRFAGSGDDLSDQLLARAEPAVDGRAAEAQLGGDFLHVDAAAPQVAVHDRLEHVLAARSRATPATWTGARLGHAPILLHARRRQRCWDDRRVQDGSLIPRFGRARRDEALAVLEGLHPLKHALRFGAEVLEVACRDESELRRLAAALAPDVGERGAQPARAVEPGVLEQLAPFVPSPGVISLARRPARDLAALLADERPAPIVLLQDPRDLGNLGACVRVAAAADAAGVLSTGTHDPWHPDVLRGAAGLHFALPVMRVEGVEQLADRGRPLLAIDPAGDPLVPAELPPRALLAFGSERYGLSGELSALADARLSIPMRGGVSSLNLATSVASVLFAWRLCGKRTPAS